MFRRKAPFWTLLPIALAGVIMLLFTADASVAQSTTDGSIYSRFGLGSRVAFHSSKNLTMGGGGLALASVNETNFSNPASWNDQILTRFIGGFTLEGISAESTGDQSSRYSSGYLNALQISFPLMIGRLGLGFSFDPYTRVGYRVESSGSTVIDPEEETVESYTTRFTGNGGLQRLSAGGGVLLTTGLSVGIRADYLFGLLEQQQSTDFLNDELRDGTLISSTRMRGATATLGVRYVVQTPFMDEDRLSIGAVYTLPVTLDAERNLTTGKTELADTLGQAISGDVDLPMSAAFGIAYQPDPRWTVVADIAYEEWSGFRSDLSLPGYDPDTGGAFRDRTRLSAGIEFFPGAGETIPTYFERMSFRIGIWTDKSYVSPTHDADIDAFGVTGGLSIPSQSLGTSIDINLEVGRRGTTDFGLISDKFVRFGLSLNFGERWFDRARLR